MDEKRMVGDYTVINSMYIGHREIILGENPKAASGERYVCCYAERVLFYEQYLEAQVSDDFAEIVKLYGERVTQAADEIMKETEKVASEIGMNDEITAKDCKPISHDDAIEDKVIVIRGNVLRPEFRHASHQLCFAQEASGHRKTPEDEPATASPSIAESRRRFIAVMSLASWISVPCLSGPRSDFKTPLK